MNILKKLHTENMTKNQRRHLRRMMLQTPLPYPRQGKTGAAAIKRAAAKRRNRRKAKVH